MTQRTRIEVVLHDPEALSGFALTDDRAGRFVAASLRSSVQSVGRGTAIERRSWGNLAWTQFEAERPSVACVAVIAPRLTRPRRLLARRGLPTATIHGVAGYTLAHPVTLGVLSAVLTLCVAVVAWAGGSKIWQGALVAAIASTAWNSIGAIVSARSGLIRRVDDPTHLAVLGRVEEALRALGKAQGRDPRRSSADEEIWWAAAASRQAAGHIAENLEALVLQRRQDRPSSLFEGERPATPAALGMSHRTPDLWDTFYRVVDEHRLYETDIEKILAAPQLTNLEHPATAAFVTALVEAQEALQDLDKGAIPADRAAAVLHQLELSWHAAQQSAEQARLSGFAADEQASLRSASDLIKHALHDSSSSDERQDCYRSAMHLLDGLVDLPADLARTSNRDDRSSGSGLPPKTVSEPERKPRPPLDRSRYPEES